MIVVADTSPLNYLVLIGAVGVLPELTKILLFQLPFLKNCKPPKLPKKCATS